VSPLNPPHILSVNLQLSLSLISCIGLSISHLFLFLALSSPFRLMSVGTRWPLRLPPNKPPTLFFPRRSPPPSVFCPCSFSYSLQNGSLRLTYFLLFSPQAHLFSGDSRDRCCRLSHSPHRLCLSAFPSFSFMLT